MTIPYQMMCGAEHPSDVEYVEFQRFEDKAKRQKTVFEEAQELVEVSSATKAHSPCGLSEANTLGATQVRTLSQLSIYLLHELLAAHLIIQNALNLMTVEQRREWSLKNARDTVHGKGITRTNERESVLIDALKAAYGADINALNPAKVMEMLAKTTGGLQ